ncbi:hypothetical protein ACHAWC_007544, partial [Mediolabrus comicus]
MILNSETNAFTPTTILRSTTSPSSIIYKKRNQNIQNSSIEFMKRRSLHVVYDSNISGDNTEEEKEEDVKKRVQQEIFWAKQRAMAAEFAAKEDAGLKSEQKEKFAQRRMALVSDTAYFSVLIACLLWIVSANPFVTISYLFGTMSGTAYAYGLGKYVETIGGSIDDAEIEGAGIGQARFAFLILLFV